MKQIKSRESFEYLVDLLGELAVCNWLPDDLNGFSGAVEHSVFAGGSCANLLPLPDGIAEHMRGLAEEADAWPDADAIPQPLSFE